MLTKQSKTQKILKALQVNGTMNNRQLNDICFRYGARIHELRNDGYLIVTNRVKSGLFEFTLKGHSEDRKEYGDSY